MKRFLAIAIAAGTALMLSGSAFAAGTINEYQEGMYANGIARSRHNLGNMGNYITVAPGVPSEISPKGEGGGASEICVFCHTPHHTVSELETTTGTMKSISPAPLWNRIRTNTTSTFIGYGSTIGGSSILGSEIGGVTLACLSCHDGVTAMDNLANIPGPGLWRRDANKNPMGTSGWIWQDAIDPRGEINGYQIGAEERLRIGGNFRGTTSDTVVDLSDDHPMSVTYCGQNTTVCSEARASLRQDDTELSTIDLSTGLYLSTADVGGTLGTFDVAYATEMKNNISQNRWAVKGFVSNTATIGDLLRGNPGKVECSSCHDPHFKNLSNADLNFSDGGERDWGTYTINKQDGLFLRRIGGNAGSGVCRTCHNK